MWHRDWLEERRTGVPSGRGERYARHTDGRRRDEVCFVKFGRAVGGGDVLLDSGVLVL